MKKENSATSKSFLFFVTFLSLFFIYLSFTKLNHFHSSMNSDIKFQKPKLMKQNQLYLQHPEVPEASKISCDRSHWSYDTCKINGPTVLDPSTSTFYVMEPATTMVQPVAETIRPYPRKWENSIMARIKELTITSLPSIPPCQTQHNAPALVFSAGGYTGNFFHEFSDGIIPLFITVNSVYQNDKDLVLVISKIRDWWINKYADLLQGFSKYPIINLDNDTSSHCFPSATLGLITHGTMAINHTLMPNSTNFTHFHTFLDRVYSPLSKKHQPDFTTSKLRPRLVLITRSSSAGRAILNQNEVKQLAVDVGFDVTEYKPSAETPLWKAYAIMKSSHAMIGVHGAALTHLLFLRHGAVFGQVVPLGTEWVARICYEIPAKMKGLEYMEYQIGIEESNLKEKYGINSVMVKDPVGFQQGKNWSSGIKEIYLKQQNVRLDLVKFRNYLEELYYKAKMFMDSTD